MVILKDAYCNKIYIEFCYFPLPMHESNVKPEISAMRKNQWPYTYVGLGGVENGHMVGVGGVGVTHALCSVFLNRQFICCIGLSYQKLG